MSKSSTKKVESETKPETADNPDVVIVKTATAPKLSPRGEGCIDYQVGRIGRGVHVRIEKNHGGGSCSKEWVPVEKIRAAITPSMLRGEPFKSAALAGAYVGRSQCNSGFLVAALRAEGVFLADAEHTGMSKLSGDLDGWELAMGEVPPLLGDDGQPVTAKLHPEPKETRFRPKQATPDAAATGATATEPETPATGDAEGEPRQILRRIRRVRVATDETPPEPGGESASQVETSDPAVA